MDETSALILDIKSLTKALMLERKLNDKEFALAKRLHQDVVQIEESYCTFEEMQNNQPEL